MDDRRKKSPSLRTGCESIGAAGRSALRATRACASRPGPSDRGDDAHGDGRGRSHAGQPNGDPSTGQRGGARSARDASAHDCASGPANCVAPPLVNKFTIRRGAPRRYYTTIRSYWRPSEMRFHGIALLASAAILGACGGEKTPAADTSAAATPRPRRRPRPRRLTRPHGCPLPALPRRSGGWCCCCCAGDRQDPRGQDDRRRDGL